MSYATRYKSSVTIKNNKAFHDYTIIEKEIAGILLTGTEIKSIRAGKASLIDSFCYVHNNALWLKNSYVAPYSYGDYNNVPERRERKLLMTKQQIRKFQEKSKDPGFTIIPLRMFISDNGLCKVEVAVCKGNHEYDKRQIIKEKESKREISRAIKNY